MKTSTVICWGAWTKKGSDTTNETNSSLQCVLCRSLDSELFSARMAWAMRLKQVSEQEYVYHPGDAASTRRMDQAEAGVEAVFGVARRVLAKDLEACASRIHRLARGLRAGGD